MLQFANAIVGFIEEKNAGDAIAALKARLAPMCHVCRDGSWKSMEARNLVPGDLIELAIGNIIPADSRLCKSAKPMQIDQAALTGESLPVTKHAEEKLLMGSAVKQGEAHAVVVATGQNTFFGKAAGLINSVVTQGRLQLVLLRITVSLLVLSLVLCAIIFAFLMTRTIEERAIAEGESRVLGALSVVIVILVASIPIAIEVVCTSTLAVGSHSMSNKGIIVARLSAIEELAGMNILCSDKTGTLTKNKLELQTPIVLADSPPCDVVFYAALCSKRAVGNQDAIDFAICDAKSNGGLLNDALAVRGQQLSAFKELEFIPFNPTDKRTLSRVLMPDGTEIEIAKGAPTVILRMSHNTKEIETTVRGYVQDLADRGFRALGVAINLNPPHLEEKKWEYLGILSIFDPPRDDTKATIAAAIASGIAVKMVTGDHGAIARETCRTLGMGDMILNTTTLDDKTKSQATLDQIILACDGFAEVMPEHKFKIVERIRAMGNVCGMTGDGVNDAPALKRADVGIAVAGATDAARAAADLVLTEEGLSVIIDAIFESRKIFQRMRNYIIYRIACTIQLLVFFFLAILLIDPDGAYYFKGQYCTILTPSKESPILGMQATLGGQFCDARGEPTTFPGLTTWISDTKSLSSDSNTAAATKIGVCCQNVFDHIKEEYKVAPDGAAIKRWVFPLIDNTGFNVLVSDTTNPAEKRYVTFPATCPKGLHTPSNGRNCEVVERVQKLWEADTKTSKELAPMDVTNGFHGHIFGLPYASGTLGDGISPAPWPYASNTGFSTLMFPFSHDYLNNVLAHAQSFTLPVISMVLITILNDGCMITISQDRVQAEKFPQKWKLFEATIVAITLGVVACISTIFLLVGLLHNNFAQGSNQSIASFIGSNGRNYVTWFEARTMIYLKVSVSDFLTLFSARTRTWFWERSVGGPLLIAAVVALFCSTMLALFWGTLPKLTSGSYMASLSESKGAAFCVWLYCILWWLVQDACKVYTYFLLDLRTNQGSWKAALSANWDILMGRAPPPSIKKGVVVNPAAIGINLAAEMENMNKAGGHGHGK